MEYLQYQGLDRNLASEIARVLNLVISGIPSILNNLNRVQANRVWF